MAVAALTNTAVNLTTNWRNLDLELEWRLTVLLIVLIAINIMRVRAHPVIEYFLGWMKILMVVGLTLHQLGW